MIVSMFLQVKEHYYKDTRSSGPQSQILEGVTWDEAAAMRVRTSPILQKDNLRIVSGGLTLVVK